EDACISSASPRPRMLHLARGRGDDYTTTVPRAARSEPGGCGRYVTVPGTGRVPSGRVWTVCHDCGSSRAGSLFAAPTYHYGDRTGQSRGRRVRSMVRRAAAGLAPEGADGDRHRQRGRDLEHVLVGGDAAF